MFLLHSCNISIYYNYLIMLTIFYRIDIELVITFYYIFSSKDQALRELF